MTGALTIAAAVVAMHHADPRAAQSDCHGMRHHPNAVICRSVLTVTAKRRPGAPESVAAPTLTLRYADVAVRHRDGAIRVRAWSL